MCIYYKLDSIYYVFTVHVLNKKKKRLFAIIFTATFYRPAIIALP